MSSAPVPANPRALTFSQAVSGPPQHPLKTAWTLWFLHRKPADKLTDYMSAVSHIGTFRTIEEFWSVWSRIKIVNQLPYISDVMLFREGLRPVWEDSPNGGKWSVRLRKPLTPRLWESLVLGLIGEQFENSDDICGAVLSVRQNENIVSVWNKDAGETGGRLRIKDTIKRVMNLPPNCVMEYKAHKAAMTDGTSFKNTEQFR